MKVDREARRPFYIQIYEGLRQEIQEEKFGKGEYLPSEKDLAQLFGVDRQTIRRSLDLLVNDGVVEKRPGVGTLVRDLSNIVHTNATDRGNIAFVLPKGPGLMDRLSEPFYTDLFVRLDQLCSADGFQLMYRAVADENELEAFVDRNRIMGIVFVSSHQQSTYQYARGRSIPAVVDNVVSDLYPSVQRDSEAGVHLAVARLVELGHRRIAFLGGLEGYYSTRKRHAAYLMALSSARLPIEGQVVKYGDWTFDSGYLATNEMLEENGRPPTAVFACNDMMAAGVVESIKNAGLSVPEDVSVVGHDDIDRCTLMRPRLTTIRVDRRLTAHTLYRNLQWSIESGSIDVYRVIIPCRLVERESIGPAAS
jgi:LacI family transcriptional regulator